jgi:hypothetical protein
MTQRARRDRPESALCPTRCEHEVEIAWPGGVLSVIALSCPGCTRPCVTEELNQIVAARQRTIAGVANLPPATRAGLAATGTLERLYRGTVAEVCAAAERCRAWLGVELPARLRAEACPSSAGRGQVSAVLDAANAWVAGLAPCCDHGHKDFAGCRRPGLIARFPAVTRCRGRLFGFSERRPGNPSDVQREAP